MQQRIRTNSPASAKMSTLTSTASITSYQKARKARVFTEDNEVPLQAVARYIMGDSLMRVCTGLSKLHLLQFNKKIPVVVIVPSSSQEKIRCDACPGKHSLKNRYCSGNRVQKRKFPAGKAMRLRDRVIISVRLEEIHILRGRKRGRAFLTRV